MEFTIGTPMFLQIVGTIFVIVSVCYGIGAGVYWLGGKVKIVYKNLHMLTIFAYNYRHFKKWKENVYDIVATDKISAKTRMAIMEYVEVNSTSEGYEKTIDPGDFEAFLFKLQDPNDSQRMYGEPIEEKNETSG